MAPLSVIFLDKDMNVLVDMIPDVQVVSCKCVIWKGANSHVGTIRQFEISFTLLTCCDKYDMKTIFSDVSYQKQKGAQQAILNVNQKCYFPCMFLAIRQTFYWGYLWQ